MIIEYAPEGGERRRWNLTQIKVMAAEAETIERLTDWTWGEANQQLNKGSIRALRVFAFVLEKRAHPTLKFPQFTPAADELDYWLDDEERDALRAQFENADGLGDEERAQMLAALDDLDAVIAAKDTAAADEDSPKDSDAGASPTAA